MSSNQQALHWCSSRFGPAADKLPPDKLAEVVELLEFRGSETQHVAIRQDIIKRLDVPSAGAVLDAGTGTGVYARDFARATQGRVAALDASEAMLEQARQLAQGMDIEWAASDIHSMPYPDASFDVVFAAMTLSHVEDIPGAIDELWRVTAPGGRLALLEQDLKALVIHGDPRVERRIMDAFCETIVNPRCALALHGILTERADPDVSIVPYVYIDTEYTLYIRSFAERSSQVAFNAGAITADERAAWLAGHEEDARSGRFFAAYPYFLFHVTRPA